jgi:hypothetical protein
MKGVIRACSVCILGWPNVLQDLQRGGEMATHLCHMATFDCEQPIKTKKKSKGGHVETMRGRKERRSAEEESGSCQLHCIACSCMASSKACVRLLSTQCTEHKQRTLFDTQSMAFASVQRVYTGQLASNATHVVRAGWCVLPCGAAARQWPDSARDESNCG